MRGAKRLYDFALLQKVGTAADVALAIPRLVHERAGSPSVWTKLLESAVDLAPQMTNAETHSILQALVHYNPTTDQRSAVSTLVSTCVTLQPFAHEGCTWETLVNLASLVGVYRAGSVEWWA
jgi:hypothetical protein